jgi:hypothetical protein
VAVTELRSYLPLQINVKLPKKQDSFALIFTEYLLASNALANLEQA